MYIFRRTSTVHQAHIQPAMEFAVAIAAKVTQITGRDLSVFTTLFGAPVGTIHWTTRVDSMADLGDLTAKLAADPGYGEMTTKASSLFAGLPEDSLVNIVSSSAMTPTTRHFYSSTVAVPANGKIVEAVAFGVKTQTRVATTGLTTAFGTSVFGAYGGVGWLVGADSMAELDTLQHFMTTDAEFGSMVAEAGSLFVEGSGVNSLIQKLN